MKVLLVDDSKDVLSEWSKTIQSIDGIKIVGKAHSEDEAKNLFQIKQPDVICLDIRLQEGSGINVLNYIKSEKPSSIVLMLTNYPYPQYKKKCRDMGANYFYDKSTEFQLAIQKLKELKYLVERYFY
jgi:DNA-binding NarL/FixJ family response regulator